MKRANLEEKILEFLKKNKDNEYFLTKLAVETGMCFPSVSKYVSILETKGKVSVRQLAQLKFVKYRDDSND